MTENALRSPKEILLTLIEEVSGYFAEVEANANVDEPRYWGIQEERDYYWDQLPESIKTKAYELSKRFVSFFGQLAPVLKSAPLLSEADQRDLMLGNKAIRSALFLRHFIYRDTDVLHDQGEVLGVQQAYQRDDIPETPKKAMSTFLEWTDRFYTMLDLLEAGGSLSKSTTNNISSIPDVLRYRRDTAFIMMWMSSELDDVLDTIKEVCRKFDITAIRADEIQHEDLITKHVLEQISTAEFLFADLTGARPNVYYEVGYAHALGKYPILSRKAGETTHFDLAQYNHIEYHNMREFRDKLHTKLQYMTSKNIGELKTD